MELSDALQKIGWTRHESSLYLALCREGELSGYEAAKITGISRSNAYLALAGLVEKGGAYKVEKDPAQYVAVPARELAANIRRQTEEVLDYIIANVPDQDKQSTPFITITGKNHVVAKMQNILAEARERIYLSCSHAELRLVATEVEAARDRGLKVVVITAAGYQPEGVTVYRRHKEPGQIRLIADSLSVLTGEILPGNQANCLYSRNKNLVQLIKDSLTNEIQLITANAQVGRVDPGKE